MNNIFENAKFGDKFRTRDGKMVIFYIVNGFGVTLLNEFGLEHYHNDGVAYHNSPNEDVVFEWQEPINEEELARQYAENSLFGDKTKKQVAYTAYLRGYRKAMEE